VDDDLEDAATVAIILQPLLKTVAGYLLSTPGVIVGFTPWPMRLVQNGKKVEANDEAK
jgi:hypothetical protein